MSQQPQPFYELDGNLLGPADSVPITLEELTLLAEKHNLKVAKCEGCIRLTICSIAMCDHPICCLCTKKNPRCPCPTCPQVDTLVVMDEILKKLGLSEDMQKKMSSNLAVAFDQGIPTEDKTFDLDLKDMNEMFGGLMGKLVGETFKDIGEKLSEVKKPEDSNEVDGETKPSIKGGCAQQ